jgi:hypothetical protein
MIVCEAVGNLDDFKELFNAHEFYCDKTDIT